MLLISVLSVAEHWSLALKQGSTNCKFPLTAAFPNIYQAEILIVSHITYFFRLRRVLCFSDSGGLFVDAFFAVTLSDLYGVPKFVSISGQRWTEAFLGPDLVK
jgi:hypothetical protein